MSDQPPKAKKLTARQELFCLEYIKDRNGAQAAIRAGFSEKGAKQIASRLLTDVDVVNKVTALGSKVLAEHEVDCAYVVKGFKGLAEDVAVEPKVRATCYEKLGDYLGMFEHTKKVEKSGPGGGPIQKQNLPVNPEDIAKMTDEEINRMLAE